MKISDIKILWGRAANRCAFPNCRIELTPDGRSVLGEIAHIVAMSPSGPRGNNELSLADKDDYSNLLLLCPTHHALVDSDPEKWTVDKLKLMKLEHERWVSSQLEQGRIVIKPIDNSPFLDNRKREWIDFADKYVWVISSLTPLNITDDITDPLEPSLLDLINNLILPYDITGASTPNRYNTCPNEYGVVNEDLKHVEAGLGYRIQVGRNGHCEIFFCLEYSTRQASESISEKKNKDLFGARVIRYTDIAKSILNQFENLKKIWEMTLPLHDMLMTVMIANTASTRLFSKEGTLKDTVGSLIRSNKLEYSSVINKDLELKLTAGAFIKRFVNYFGLILDDVFDEKGDMVRPKFLHS
jgi:hypothetical protein